MNNIKYLTIAEFKIKFFDFQRHRKKVKALDNLSTVEDFKFKSHLDLLKLCMKTDFLEKEEADFLDFMLMKYDIDWKYWYHKSPWLKKHLSQRRVKRCEDQERARRQLEFSFTRHAEAESRKIPLHMLTKTSSMELRR